MAKKRKASRAAAEPSGPKDYDSRDARLGPVTTFEDIADEQEEYFLDRDKILFEDEPGTKRQRRQQEEEDFLELSDASVLGDDDADDSANEAFGADDRGARRRALKKSSKARKAAGAKRAEVEGNDDDDDDDDAAAAGGDGSDAEGDQGWWGSSKAEYYDGEAIETEAGALEEEEEARRLQKAQLARMTAADFFDAADWAAAPAPATATATEAPAAAAAATTTTTTTGGSGMGVVTVTMKTAEAIGAMTPEEQRQQLRLLYPEFDHVCDEFAALEPLLGPAAKAAAGRPSTALEVVRYRVLSCYLATMALYFSLLTAPARDRPDGPQRLTDPAELHDHEVMASLVDCRETWAWVQRVHERRAAGADDAMRKSGSSSSSSKTSGTSGLALLEAVSERPEAAEPEAHTPPKAATKKKAAAKAKAAKEKKPPAAVPKEVEASLAALSALLKKKKKPAQKTKATKAARHEADASAADEDDESDFGEEEALDARTAEEKLKRKKTLGFYTSQIMQKANLRTGAPTASASGGGGGGGGGDVDIPYRERLRDRQARLNAAAVRRGQAAAQAGDELGGDSSSGDEDDAKDSKRAGAGGGDDADLQYYNSIVRKHEQKQGVKLARKADEAAARLQRVEPAAAADADGRRQLSWEIAKNKGLSHRTLKEKKNNPRVKKRLKFEKKKKQLASMRPVYKAVDRNNYQGERTGIKTDVVRAIRL